jgi:hypothetical protein
MLPVLYCFSPMDQGFASIPIPPNKALHLTAIALRSIAAGELYR